MSTRDTEKRGEYERPYSGQQQGGMGVGWGGSFGSNVGSSTGGWGSSTGTTTTNTWMFVLIPLVVIFSFGFLLFTPILIPVFIVGAMIFIPIMCIGLPIVIPIVSVLGATLYWFKNKSNTNNETSASVGYQRNQPRF